MERPSKINHHKVLLMLMTSLIMSQRDVKVRWKKEMDTDSAYLTNSQYIQSCWFSNKSNINIIYNISVITITIAITIILENFGKYAISDCPFICLSVCPSVCPSHLFDYVPIIVSSWNFQELSPRTRVTSMQKFQVRGQRSRSQRSRPNLTVSGL